MRGQGPLPAEKAGRLRASLDKARALLNAVVSSCGDDLSATEMQNVRDLQDAEEGLQQGVTDSMNATSEDWEKIHARVAAIGAVVVVTVAALLESLRLPSPGLN